MRISKAGTCRNNEECKPEKPARKIKVFATLMSLAGLTGAGGIAGMILDRNAHVRGLMFGSAAGFALGMTVCGLLHSKGADETKQVRYFSEVSPQYKGRHGYL